MSILSEITRFHPSIYGSTITIYYYLLSSIVGAARHDRIRVGSYSLYICISVARGANVHVERGQQFHAKRGNYAEHRIALEEFEWTDYVSSRISRVAKL